MLTVRTMGVVIALSAAASAFAGDQVPWRADELRTDSHLSRAQVIAQYQAARAAHQIVEGELSIAAPQASNTANASRTQVQAEATAARDAGWHTLGERYLGDQ